MKKKDILTILQDQLNDLDELINAHRERAVFCRENEMPEWAEYHAGKVVANIHSMLTVQKIVDKVKGR